MSIALLRSRVAFCVYSESGNDCSSFLNVMHSSGMRFYGLIKTDNELCGFVKRRDYAVLCRLAQDKGFSVRKLFEQGIHQYLRKYRYRWGIVIGIVLAAAFVMFMSDRVTVIEIRGNETISREHVISLLSDAGIKMGSRISAVDLREAERDILAMEKNIGWIGIRHTGSRVIAQIEETDPVPEMERKNNPCNIISVRDAQIINVKVGNGVLVPMIGEGVRKGDILISGVVETKYGRTYYVHSIGEITGRYTEKMTFSQPFDDTEMICVGTAEKRSVIFFGKRIVYFSKGDITGEYECDETITPVTIGKVTLPISFSRESYRIMAESTVRRTEEEAEEMLSERMARYEQNMYSDRTIADRNIVRTVNQKGITITVEYTIEGEIGEERMIFAKYEPDGVNIKKENVK